MTKAKMTLREYYTALLAIDEVKDNPILKEMTEGRISALDRKTASGEKKPTANQVANEALKANIVAEMEDEKQYTVGEMIKILPSCKDLSSSKVTAMVTQLLKSGKVLRCELKGKAYYSKA